MLEIRFPKDQQLQRKIEKRRESRKVWSTFLIAVLIAAILGISVRIIFAPARLQAEIQYRLEASKIPFKIRFAKAQLQLADRGLFPQIALELKKVRLERIASETANAAASSACEAAEIATIEQLEVPLDILALLQGRVKIGVVRGHEAVVFASAFQCGSRFAASKTVPSSTLLVENPKVSGAATSAPDRSDVQSPANTHVRLLRSEDFDRIETAVGGVFLDSVRIQLSSDQGVAAPVTIRDLSARLISADRAVEVSAEAEVAESVLGGFKMGVAQIRGKLSSSDLNGKIKVPLSEGRVEVDFLSDGVDVKLSAEAINVPLSSVWERWPHASQTFGSIKPKFVWLNCSINTSTTVRQLSQLASFQVQSCVIDGDNGQLRLEPVRVDLRTGIQNWVVDFDRIDVRKALALADRSGPRGILNEFGSVSGQMRIKNLHAIELDFRWKDFIGFFSRRSVRATQKVASLEGHLELENETLRARLTNLELDNGAFQGRILGEYSLAKEDGLIQVDVEQLDLDPQVQRLMVDGVAKRLAVKGEFKIHDGRFVGWAGDVFAQAIEGEHVQFVQPRFKTNFADGTFVAKGRVAEGSFDRQAKHFGLLQKFFFDGDGSLSSASFRDLKGEFALAAQKFEWRQVSVRFFNGKVAVESAGELDVLRKLNGEVYIDFPKTKRLHWSLRGTNDSPTLEPVGLELNRMIEQRKSLADFGLVAAASKSFSGEAGVEQSLGRQVLRKAKEIMPSFSSDEADTDPSADTNVGSNGSDSNNDGSESKVPSPQVDDLKSSTAVDPK